MAYRVSFADGVAESVRTCAAEELATATSLLDEEFDRNPVDAVHEARKSLKKSRALLRLVRPGWPKRAYRRENGMLRDAGRLVSGARDADVMIETVDALADRYAGRVPVADFDGLRDHLRAQAFAGRSGHGAADGRARAVAMLDQVAGRIPDWPLAGSDWGTVAAGMERAYRRGRHAFAAVGAADGADDAPTVEALHDWRKRVKDLWYHQRLIAPAWPEVLGAQAEEAHRLSEILGDDHDLAVLAERLGDGDGDGDGQGDGEGDGDGQGDGEGEGEGDGGRVPVPVDPDPMLELIAERRSELLAQARRLGSLIYAERPKAFAHRVRHILETARAAEAVEADDGQRV